MADSLAGYSVQTWYRVWTTNEDGKRATFLGCLRSEGLAKAFALGKDPSMNGPGDASVERARLLVNPEGTSGNPILAEEIPLMQDADAILSVREAALAKLTKEEREVLGL